MNSVFAIKKKKKKKKKKKARMMLAVDQKIDENLNIIERLERVFTSGTSRVVRLHEWYECDLCKEFHPVSLNSIITSTVRGDILSKNPMFHQRISQLLEPLLQLRPPSMPEYVGICQQVDAELNELKKFVSSAQASVSSKEFRQMVWDNMHQLDCCFYVAKCFAEGKRICVKEIKQRFILDPEQPERDLYGLPENIVFNMHIEVYQAVRVFTSDPVDHWFEITDFNLHIEPLWFNCSRVYQFYVKVSGDQPDKETTRYEISMKIGSAYQPVLNWESKSTHGRACLELGNMKKSIMSFQLLTTKGSPLLSELRLCYYGNNKKPRVWIRSPLARLVADSDPLNFVPIYSDVSHASSLNGVFAIKKAEARLMATVD